MAGMGIWEIFMMLFLLGAPGAPYGHPAPAATVFGRVPDGAAVVVAVDVASLAQGIDKRIDKLLNMSFVKKSPVLKMAATALEASRQMMLEKVRQIGVDPLKDIRYLTVAFRPPVDGRARVLIVAGGKFPPGILDNLAKLSGSKKDGDLLIIEDDPNNQTVLAKADAKTLVFGNRTWVEQARSGKKKNHDKTLRKLLKGFSRSTYFMLAFKPDASIRAEWNEADPMARPLLDHLRALSVRFGYKNEMIDVVTDDPKFVDIYKGLLDGLGQMAMAGWQFTSGTLAVGEAYLGSLEKVAEFGADLPPEGRQVLRVLIDRRREIRKLLQGLLLGKKTSARALGLKRQRIARLVISGHGASSMMFLGAMLGGVFWAVKSEPNEAPPVKAPAAVAKPLAPPVAAPPVEPQAPKAAPPATK